MPRELQTEFYLEAHRGLLVEFNEVLDGPLVGDGVHLDEGARPRLVRGGGGRVQDGGRPGRLQRRLVTRCVGHLGVAVGWANLKLKKSFSFKSE